MMMEDCEAVARRIAAVCALLRYEAANAGLDGLTLIMQLALEQANEFISCGTRNN
jgi:hypothetical protein